MASNGNGNGHRLTDKQSLFIERYLQCWNATQAALDAGYSEKTARQMGSENLSKPVIRDAIENRLRGEAMSANEVLWRLGNQARGDITQVMRTDVPGGMVDLEALEQNGHLVKSISWNKSGVRVELYDSQRALELIGKHYGLFKDVSDVNIRGLDTAIERELEKLADPGQGPTAGETEAKDCGGCGSCVASVPE